MKKKRAAAELEQEPADMPGDPIMGENPNDYKIKKGKKKKKPPQGMAAAVMVEWVVNRFFDSVPESIMQRTELELEHYGYVTESTVALWEAHLTQWKQ